MQLVSHNIFISLLAHTNFLLLRWSDASRKSCVFLEANVAAHAHSPIEGRSRPSFFPRFHLMMACHPLAMLWLIILCMLFVPADGPGGGHLIRYSRWRTPQVTLEVPVDGVMLWRVPTTVLIHICGSWAFIEFWLVYPLFISLSSKLVWLY